MFYVMEERFSDKTMYHRSIELQQEIGTECSLMDGIWQAQAVFTMEE